MQQWHVGMLSVKLVVTLGMVVSIALLGCSNNNDNVTAEDIENRTFQFDSSFIDSDLAGLTTTLTFQAASGENSVPFDMTLRDDVADAILATLSGTAAINSIELRIEEITDEDDNMVDSIVIFDVEFTVDDVIVFDVNVDEQDDGTDVLTFTNEVGSRLVFEFEEKETSAIGTPVRQ